MNISTAALALLAIIPATTLAQECLSGAFEFEFEGSCTPEAVVEAYADLVFNLPGGVASECTTSPQDDLEAKLTRSTQTQKTLEELCLSVYDTQNKVPFTDAADRGDDLHFEQMFYNGRTDWQEEVETLFETEDSTRTNILKEDAEAVRSFHEGIAQGARVAWPGSLTNFQSSVKDANDLATCTTNAAMCCWPKDRQANDRNGNCATAYDENCVDKDPADNTNLCFVDLERSNYSDATGFVGFPEDNGNGEGAIHCHGLAWSNDVNDHTSRYKANNLFFVSMYDHMYQRGYVENIPGAPMCGCVEQMPTVSRSDCTQVDLTETIKITFDGSSVMAKLTSVHVDFNACQGINNRNNDLWAYMARLYYQGDISPKQFGEAGRIITNTGCEEATRYHLNEIGMTRGYDHDISTWTKVAGRDDFHDGHPFPKEVFNKAFFEGSLTHSTTPIMMRICATCTDTHKNIFYRRLTPITDPKFDLLNNILYHRSDGNGQNKWNVSFSLHSTYAEAVEGTNPWKCRNNAFNYGAPFDGECSPTGAQTRNQYSIWNWYPGPRNDVAYYINKPEDTGIQELDLIQSPRAGNVHTDIDLGRVGIAGRTFEADDGALHITGSGRDIYHQDDEGHYYSEPKMGDIDVKVHITAFTGIVSSYAKAGIMLRADNSDDSPHVFATLSGSRGIQMIYRRSKHGGTSYTSYHKTSPAQTSAWLRLVKKMETVEFYRSPNGIDWILHSSIAIRFPEDQFRVGLAVTSRYDGYVSEAVFEDYAIEEYNFPTSAPSISIAPTAWEPNVNVGGARAGKYTLNDNGISTYRGYGTGLLGSNDSFFFHNVQKDSAGAFDVIAYTNHFHTGYMNAKAGIMIRDSNEPDSSSVFVGLSGPYSTGVTFLSRATTGAKTDHHHTIYTPTQVWIKLSKPANSDAITASYKINVDDAWIDIGSTSISLTGTVLVGTAVTAGEENGDRYVDLQMKNFQIVDDPVRRKALRA